MFPEPIPTKAMPPTAAPPLLAERLARAVADPFYEWVSRAIDDPLREWASRNPKAAEHVRWALNQAAAPPPAGEAGLGVLQRLSRRILPPNWLNLTARMHAPIRSAMLTSGLMLAWVPRAEIAREIALADPTQRPQVLVDRQAEILDDLRTVLAEIADPHLAANADAAHEALEAFDFGFDRASQALCASLLSAVLDEHFDEREFAAARRRFQAQDPDTVDFRINRRVLVQRVVMQAITNTQHATPQGFNRHLTAHGLDPRQFTPANALSALMLIVGTLRELEELYAVGDHGFPISTCATSSPEAVQACSAREEHRYEMSR